MRLRTNPQRPLTNTLTTHSPAQSSTVPQPFNMSPRLLWNFVSDIHGREAANLRKVVLSPDVIKLLKLAGACLCDCMAAWLRGCVARDCLRGLCVHARSVCLCVCLCVPSSLPYHVRAMSCVYLCAVCPSSRAATHAPCPVPIRFTARHTRTHTATLYNSLTLVHVAPCRSVHVFGCTHRRLRVLLPEFLRGLPGQWLGW